MGRLLDPAELVPPGHRTTTTTHPPTPPSAAAQQLLMLGSVLMPNRPPAYRCAGMVYM